MYHGSGEARSARGQVDTLPGPDPAAPARLALARVRAALTAFTPGMPFDAARYRAALAVSLTPESDAERLFCLGWLHWLNGDSAAAEPLFTEAADRARATNNAELLAEAGYWRARIELHLRRADALPAYETVLRATASLPRATVGFIDLLWRAGRVERAEQILKAVRGNRRFAACDEVPLLEARSLLRRGDLAAGERILTEAVPAGTVAQAERWMLLAWTAASQNKHEEAARRLDQARLCLYPTTALEEWQRSLARRAGIANPEASAVVPAAFADYLRGQDHRLAGRWQEAAEAYRAALNGPAAPFARFALARIGQDDFATLLAARPGLFLALRCRAQLAIERFLRREASSAECLDALQLAATVGYGGAAADHYRTIATALRQRNSEVAALKELAATPAAEPAARRNFLRAAAELAVRHLSPGEACSLLESWSSLTNGDLRASIDRQLLRARLLSAAEAIADRTDAAPDSIALVDALATLESFPHAAAIWSAARALAAGETSDAWRDSLRSLPGRWRPLARALLLREAASRNDPVAVAGLLDEHDVWHGFGARPPRFVMTDLESAVAARPDHPVWEQSLSRWLGLWPGTISETLVARTMQGARATVPPGMQPAPWFLHQTSRALLREDYLEALACARRALAEDVTAGTSEVVRAALPELERYARAQALTEALRPDGLTPTPAGLLVQAVDLLLGLPEGVRLIEAAMRGDRSAVEGTLAELCAVSVLPPGLAHHLALLERRSAEFLDAEGLFVEAVAAHRRSWAWWLKFLAADPPDGPAPESAGLLAEALLGGHRRSVNALLARGAVDAARLQWELVGELPARAARIAPELGEDFAGRVGHFRDELATDFLLATREAMRNAPAPEGYRADYNTGLIGLRRLLSLDRDNLRLLTALVDTCGDWFFDLYNAGARAALAEQVERFTPFALQLARLVEGRPSDLAARSGLAGFTKFRGFVASDPARKAELYREALRFNPADGNVRDLLAQLEGTGKDPGD
jgi:hypothetical protein